MSFNYQDKDDILQSLCKPCYKLSFVSPENYLSSIKTKRPESAYLLSKNSFFGGNPHVPSNFTWPISQSGHKLNFLCQIDLADVSRLAQAAAQRSSEIQTLLHKDILFSYLPRTGTLAFFALVEGEDDSDTSWQDAKVMYFTAGTTLQEVSSPAPILPRLYLGLKDMSSYMCLTEFYERNDFSEFGLKFPDVYDLYDFKDIYAEILDQMEEEESNAEAEESKLQLMGFAHYIQNPVEDAKLIPLLSIKSYFNPKTKNYETCYGDAGTLYFHIPKDALVQGDFSQVVFERQCY